LIITQVNKKGTSRKSQRKAGPVFGLTQDIKASDVLCALCGFARKRFCIL
jgi:hypothetical protein